MGDISDWLMNADISDFCYHRPCLGVASLFVPPTTNCYPLLLKYPVNKSAGSVPAMGSCTTSSGPPGVGKTLTAEGIAETKELPLYNVCQSSARPSPRLIMSRCAQET